MNSMLVPIVLVLVAVAVASGQSCPSGGDRVWVALGESCYSTSHMAMDWGTAQEVSKVQYSPLCFWEHLVEWRFNSLA